jgi:hypothetical protein
MIPKTSPKVRAIAAGSLMPHCSCGKELPANCVSLKLPDWETISKTETTETTEINKTTTITEITHIPNQQSEAVNSVIAVSPVKNQVKNQVEP